MDRIIQSYLCEFLKTMQINEKDESRQFELFAAYCTISQVYTESYDLYDVITGEGGDCGIDAVAVVADGVFLNSSEELEDLVKDNRSLYDIQFIFVQAKRSEKFSSKDMCSFGEGVLEFFSESPKLQKNEALQDKYNLMKSVYDKASKMKYNPKCILYYVSAGKWVDDLNCMTVTDKAVKRLKSEKLFSEVSFIPVDAELLRRYYKNATEEVEVSIEFPNAVLLPEIDNIKQAYLGYIDSTEYIKLIQDETGKLRKSVFIDNVRDYQGDVPVNKQIAETINVDADKFVIYNNGVTIICKQLNNLKRNTFTLKSFQIVNGCQTSHEIYYNRDKIKGNLQIPVKIIETIDEETVNKIITATNSQTKVADEQLIALNNFHKELEEYYKSFPVNKRLYYERRSKQYNYIPGVEKVRIISIATQIKAVAAMFFDKPHFASRYYGQLLKTVNGMFASGDKYDPYYISAYTLYRLEQLFRKGEIPWDYRKYRYHLLMMIKYDIAKGMAIPRLSENKIQEFCNKINLVVDDDKVFKEEVARMTNIIDKYVSNIKNREHTKSAELIEKLKEDVRAYFCNRI